MALQTAAVTEYVLGCDKEKTERLLPSWGLAGIALVCRAYEAAARVSMGLNSILNSQAVALLGWEGEVVLQCAVHLSQFPAQTDSRHGGTDCLMSTQLGRGV